MSDPLSQQELQLLQRLLGDPLSFPTAFKQWVTAWVEANPPQITLAQTPGASQFTAQAAPIILTRESTTSSTYGNLTTTGPTLTGLVDGKYVLLYGSSANWGGGGGQFGRQSIQVNSTAAIDDDACEAGGQISSIAMATIKTLSNGGNNTVTCKYKSTDNVNAASFARRWLIAIKYSNL